VLQITVKTENREPGNDTSTAPAPDNVVLFPRDWLGPRDELVPFGAQPDVAPAGEQKLELLGASDFWGEGSAEVQHAWEGPAADDAAGQRGVPEPVPVERPAGRERPAGPERHPTRARLTAIIAVAAIGLAVVLVELGGKRGLHAAGRDVASTHLAGSGTAVSATSTQQFLRLSEGDRPGVGSSYRVAIKTPHTRRTSSGRRIATSRRTTTRHSHPATTTYVSSSVAPTASRPSAPAASAPSEVSQSHTVSSGGSAGPSGAGAPFGPGHLGGSS
jgi:hypothetical protein